MNANRPGCARCDRDFIGCGCKQDHGASPAHHNAISVTANTTGTTSARVIACAATTTATAAKTASTTGSAIGGSRHSGTATAATTTTRSVVRRGANTACRWSCARRSCGATTTNKRTVSATRLSRNNRRGRVAMPARTTRAAAPNGTATRCAYWGG